MGKSFSVKAKIWRWAGFVNTSASQAGGSGWHFVTLDKKLSAEIRKQHTKGFVPITAKCGKSIWATSLFPHMPNKKVSKEIEYLLCINKKILKQEGLFAGDEIKINIMLK